MNRKVLVTGGNGQLGNEIRLRSDLPGFEFSFTDMDEADLTVPDIADKLLTTIAPDYIINCAAYTAVDGAESASELTEMVNAGIPENILAYAKTCQCRIIHISTDYVFAGDIARPLTENDIPHPKSIYGQTKLKGEEVLQNYTNAMVLRTSWLYSEFGNNFVKTMIRLMKERDVLNVVYDQIGTPTYAGDLAEVILQVIGAAEKEAFSPGLFHYASEGVTSWYDFAVEIKNLTGADCAITPIETKDYPQPAQRPLYSVLNKEKFKQQFGLPIPHWKESLKICLRNIEQNSK